jgi:ATP-binding cassette subfamily B protein
MSVGIEGLQMVTGSALVVWILFNRFALDDASRMLLLAYWLLNLPALGYELALLAREYPAHRSAILRLLEPLGAIDPPVEGATLPQTVSGSRDGASISFVDVQVVSSGQPVLQDIRINIARGCHVAIVGTSGAGKSTLVGLLLGWHRASSGRVLVDDAPLIGERLEELRRATAWVDPTVRLWNASLIDNITYGHPSTVGVGSVLEAAGLLSVVARLPDGLATPLGEGGALLSAGEAQRVRIARAMLHVNPRLVVLDEPFVGLERDRRRMLLGQVRHRWADTTVLYVTHDVAETRSFDRVLVVDRGRIVEDGDPQQLAQSLSSRYRRMLQAYEATQARLLSSSDWRRIRIDAGIIVQDHAGNVGQTA